GWGDAEQAQIFSAGFPVSQSTGSKEKITPSDTPGWRAASPAEGTRELRVLHPLVKSPFRASVLKSWQTVVHSRQTITGPTIFAVTNRGERHESARVPIGTSLDPAPPVSPCFVAFLPPDLCGHGDKAVQPTGLVSGEYPCL